MHILITRVTQSIKDVHFSRLQRQNYKSNNLFFECLPWYTHIQEYEQWYTHNNAEAASSQLLLLCVWFDQSHDTRSYQTLPEFSPTNSKAIVYKLIFNLIAALILRHTSHYWLLFLCMNEILIYCVYSCVQRAANGQMTLWNAFFIVYSSCIPHACPHIHMHIQCFSHKHACK